MLHQLLVGILDLLAPPCCPGCELAYITAKGETRFCAACAPLIDRTPPRLRPPARHAAAVLYQGPVADAIRHFKYASRSDRASDLAPLLVEAALAHAGRIDVVIPLPLHPSKLRERGWNPSALLARPVAQALGVPLISHWLTRVRATQAQAGLSRTQRIQNVRGAFSAKQVPAARVLLIDDVRTTSATLDEAARCLEARGHDVYSLALAWAEQDARALGAHEAESVEEQAHPSPSL